MSTKPTTFPLVRTKAHEQEDRTLITGVGLTDQEGRHAGIEQQPVPTQEMPGGLMEQVLTELRLMNLYMAEMTGFRFTREDVQ